MFITEKSLTQGTWQAFERNLCRFLTYEGFDDIRLVGRVGDKGADVLAHRHGKRWLFQAKHWKNKVGTQTVDETMRAAQIYGAKIPAIVALNGFDNAALAQQRALMAQGIMLQLISGAQLVERAAKLSYKPKEIQYRKYQEDAIRAVLTRIGEGASNRAIVVMATGLGKTITAAETIRRYSVGGRKRILVLAHTNELVYQLEREFWPFISPNAPTVIWNGYERPSDDALNSATFVFGCLNSVDAFVAGGGELPPFDLVLVDECHHVGGKMYLSILDSMRAGREGGPFLLGLTATPWRPDETDLRTYFGDPLVCVDMVTGLREGFLADVDYRMYTDNINWEGLGGLKGEKFSPKQINKTLFISQWDDAVVSELQRVWDAQHKPRCIVFCGTVDHAITMRDRINVLGFCRAEAIYSGTDSAGRMDVAVRTKTLCDFRDGAIQVVCAVDIFNEGVDVPDVNIIVFQRVTHSRRIFIQQLGRGLRLSKDKDKVVVLDFVSDIRRFAAGIELKDELEAAPKPVPGAKRISIPHTVQFVRVGGADPATESFLREWLNDVAAIEAAGDTTAVLKFPPHLPGAKP